MVKNKLSIALRFIISFGLLIVLVWMIRKDAKEILSILISANKPLIFLVILINAFLSIALAFRLKLMMSGQNILVSVKDALYLTFIGYFFNNFLPTAIGGDIAKAYYASKRTKNKVASYAAVLSDRILGLVATLLIALTGLIFIGKSIDNKLIIWSAVCIFVLAVVGIYFLLKKSNIKEKQYSGKSGIFHTIKEKVFKLYTAINLYRNNPLLLIKCILLSLALQIASIFCIYLFVLSIGSNMPISRLLLIIPIIWTVSMLPSLNGLGVREGAFVYFLKGYIGTEKAFAISLLWLGLIIFYSIVGGIYQLLYPSRMTERSL